LTTTAPKSPASTYDLLPFRFAAFRGQDYIVTNLVGEYAILPRGILVDFVRKALPRSSATYTDLKGRHFLIDDPSSVALDLLAAKYRTKLAGLASFTGLHIFVTTLRCNNLCGYCQASAISPDKARYDMSMETGLKAAAFSFKSPSPELKIEFQGGEPLLNFEIVRSVVARCAELNREKPRQLEYVLCSNLTLLTEEVLSFFEQSGMFVSTSLDGPEELHNKNRPTPTISGYRTVVKNIRRVQEAVGKSRISALMTTTRSSLVFPEAIIDEYVKLGFSSIFLRPINPYGRTTAAASECHYSSAAFCDFYRRALHYILDLNRKGIYFREEYAAIVLRKMLTPYGTGFVDLQSPSATGIGVLAYNHDGRIYASDESRMLAQMNDETFCLGHVDDDYVDVVCSDKLVDMISSTMLESIPGCTDCPYMMYCGADPVRHYRLQGDLVGHKPTSEFCAKNMEIFRMLIELLEDDRSARDIFETWVH
jgi:uncharacterized protein